MAPATPPPASSSRMTFLLSAALCAVLDEQDWQVTGSPVVVHRQDPLKEMDAEGY